MTLSPTVQKYILHWGEMGSRWGVNRTIAQIHALLYLSPEALPAEDIARVLSVARSNVSTSLRELHSYGLIKVTHRLGVINAIAVNLPEAEVPTLANLEGVGQIAPNYAVLRQCAEEAEKDAKTDAQTKARIHDMLDFVERTTTWYEQMRQVPKPVILKLMKLGSRIVKAV